MLAYAHNIVAYADTVQCRRDTRGRPAIPSAREPDHDRFPRRGFAGSLPAFVLLHGFPDNSHIYDGLIPHLVSAGRRTVAIDFPGFGASDKPEHAQYSFAQQLGDLEAVVAALGLEKSSPLATTRAAPPPSP